MSYDVSHLLGMLRRHWWLVVLFTLAGVAGGMALARVEHKVYESTATVLVAPTTSAAANSSSGRTSGVINLDTEAQLVTSSQVATAAAKLLSTTTAPATLAGQVSVAVPANTTVLAITCEGVSARDAQACAHAFAAAYLANRLATAQADLAGQSRVLTATIKTQSSALTKINNELAALDPQSARYANVQSQRQTLIGEVTALTNRLNVLTTTTVTAGNIITDAALPSRPSAPSIPLFLASGGLLGLIAGLGGATIRQRLDKRIRFAADVPRRSGLPLLTQLPARVKPRFDDVYPAHGPAGRTFNRLRNEVLASVEADDRVIMVTGASRGNASTLVAANLAAALARGGSEVVLVSAHLPESLVDAAPGTRMLGVASTPGLSDVLAGRVPLESATQRAPRNPWLSVIATGGTASAGGFLQSQTLREILAQLRTQAEYVVIEAPSTANSADAQSLASLADVSIVVVELRRTTRSELLDAALQLRRVSSAMLGCVVLPRLRRVDDEPEPARASGVTYVTAHPADDQTAVIPVHPQLTDPAAARGRRDDAPPLTARRRMPPGGRTDRRSPTARRPAPRPTPGGPRADRAPDATAVIDGGPRQRDTGSEPPPPGDQTVTLSRILDEPADGPDAGDVDADEAAR